MIITNNSISMGILKVILFLLYNAITKIKKI